MATQYPSSIDNYTNPNPEATAEDANHAGLHADHYDSVEAIETKLGTGTSTPPGGGTPLVSDSAGNSIWSSNVGLNPIPAYGENYAVFAHKDMDSAGNYGILHSNVGNLYLNCASGAQMNFRVGNIDQGFLFGNGSWVIGSSADLLSNATAGFLYLPQMGAIPTGTPVDLGYKSPIVYDYTDKILFAYYGSWKPLNPDDGGWLPACESWSYNTFDGTITVPATATNKYAKGDKIRLVQSATTKYFSVVAVGATSLTVTGGTDYTLANEAISAPYYSKSASPANFPTWFNYTPTLTGFGNSNAWPANSVAFFKIDGSSCTLVMNQSYQTSNAATYTISLPVTCATITSMNTITPALVVDNGTFANGRFRVNSGASVITVGKAIGADGGFTTSGNKCANGIIIYPI